jgi:hypothetical protein
MDPFLHQRIAEKLGWTLAQTQSFSLHTLRDIVRPISSKLAHEIDIQIQSGSVLVGSRRSRRKKY